MKPSQIIPLFTVLLNVSTACASPKATASGLDQAASTHSTTAPQVYHIVAFRFKTDAASRAQIPTVVQAFAALQEKSVAADDASRRLITSFHYGVNNSTEQVSFGTKGKDSDRSTEYDFVATFASVADRDYYVNVEPNHQAFKTLAATLFEDGSSSVFVTDFIQ